MIYSLCSAEEGHLPGKDHVIPKAQFQKSNGEDLNQPPNEIQTCSAIKGQPLPTVSPKETPEVEEYLLSSSHQIVATPHGDP